MGNAWVGGGAVGVYVGGSGGYRVPHGWVMEEWGQIWGEYGAWGTPWVGGGAVGAVVGGIGGYGAPHLRVMGE